MSSLFSHIKDGKRCWNEEGISLIQKRLDKEDSRSKFIDLKGLLEESLCAVGFEKNYKRGRSYSLNDTGFTECSWSLIAVGWDANVSLVYDTGEILFAINGEVRPLTSINVLWGILRESYYEN